MNHLSTTPPPPDYSYWTLVVSVVTLIVLGLSVLAQYLGLFGRSLKIPVGEKIIVYQKDGDIIGGIVEACDAQSVTLKKVYHVQENFTVASYDPIYLPMKHISESDVPISSISRWKRFPKDLATAWGKLPE